MSLAVGKNGTVYQRFADYDEVRARFEAGETLTELANVYGVSPMAIKYAVNSDYREQNKAYSQQWLRDRRMPCRGGCGTLVWQHGRRSGYCQVCLGERRNVVRHGTETEYSQGCRCGECTRAATAAKRRRREANRVPCSHGCGAMVDGINRRYPEKPPECCSCAGKRIHAAQKARALA